MNEDNMISTMKHFPGYGDNVDTHTGSAIDAGNDIIISSNFKKLGTFLYINKEKIIHVFKICIIFCFFYTYLLKIYKKYDILYIWR